MPDITTTEQLVQLLRGDAKELEDEAVENYRYVIYARKSTDEKENKQLRSLEDQIAECQAFAERNQLYVPHGAIIEESISAKESGIRDGFRKLLKDMNCGIYDGVIAWHPDRLARNMKDAGEVIDLLDKNIIKDLKFPSFTFTNDASGKMLLGITFALSKQYSDQLSANVKRGNKRSLQDGTYINKAKHGYQKDTNQLLRPDGHNFALIHNSFQMRLQGESQINIAKYLNKNNYTRTNAVTGKTYGSGMTKQKIAKYMKDPVYAGVVKYGNQVVDLTTVYDFQTIISVEEFMKLNKIKTTAGISKLASAYRQKHDVKADLMRGMVTCLHCGDATSAGITTKKLKGGTKRYFYYRCENDDCKRFNKSTRAHVIVNFVYAYLDKNPFSYQGSYEHYKKEIIRINELRLKEDNIKLRSTQTKRTKTQERLEKTKATLINTSDDDIKEMLQSDLKVIKKELPKIDLQITEIKERIKTRKDIPLTYEQFLELWENMAKTLKKTTNMKDLDKIIRKIFSNFVVLDKSVESYTLNPPFESLEKLKSSIVGVEGLEPPALSV